MLNNANFPNATALLDAVTKEADALDKADQVAATRAIGSKGLRDAQRARLMQALNNVVHHIQVIVNGLTSSVDAIAIILSASMSVKKMNRAVKPALSAKQGRVSGEAIVDAKSVPRAVSYYWQFSQNQTSWTNVPEVTTVSSVIGGLTPGQTYYFRFRTLSPAGMSDFSQIVSLLVY